MAAGACGCEWLAKSIISTRLRHGFAVRASHLEGEVRLFEPGSRHRLCSRPLTSRPDLFPIRGLGETPLFVLSQAE